MSEDLSKYNWMANVFGKGLWDSPVDQDSAWAGAASQDASRDAGAGHGKLCTHCHLRPSTWTCEANGCTVTKAFRSRWDLERHIRVAHNGGQKDLVCPFLGCFKGTQASAFARGDKLTSHIKTCHRTPLDVLLACPAHGCSVGRSQLKVLAEHIRNDHLVDGNPRKQRERCGNEVEILRAVANAAPAAVEE